MRAIVSRVVALFRRRSLDRRLAFSTDATPIGGVLRVEPGGQGIVAGKLLERPLLLMAPAALLLVVGCLNVSTLLVARSALRMREVGVRSALGAGRTRLLRQLLTENLVLAGGAGLLGILFSESGKDVAGAVLFSGTGAAVDTLGLHTNGAVLLFAIGLTLFTGLLCGLVPAIRGSRIGASALMTGQPSDAGGPSFVARCAIVVQVALSLLLLIGGGLLGRTIHRLVFVDAGFDVRGLIRVDGLGHMFSAPVQLPAEQLVRLRADAIERLAGIDGVQAITTWRGSDAIDDGGVARWSVQSDFFRVLSVPIVKGRDFVEGEGPEAVINESMAMGFFAGTDPIGRQLPVARDRQVVGVAKNVRVDGARRGRNTESLEDVPAAYYVPDFVDAGGPMDVALRVAVDPEALMPAVREAIRVVHPSLSPFVGTQAALMASRAFGGGQFGNAAVLGSALAVFAVLSLLLVTIGLYGVTSYSTAARTREFGVRLALGAAPRALLVQVLAEVFRLVALGGVVGVALSVPLLMVFRRLILRVMQPEFTAPILALLLMMAAAALAAYLPARRASRTEPLAALRTD
jgi:predicted permease